MRSKKKGIYVNKIIYNKILELNKTNKKKIIKTKYKNFVILPEYKKVLFKVYNGRRYVDFFVTEHHIGHKLGEFIKTRKHGKHTLVTKASRKQIRK